MLADRDLVALPFVLFVPLIVVVEDQRDDVVEVVDEAVGRGRIDQAVEPAVEVGEVVKAVVDFVQQRDSAPRAMPSSCCQSGELSRQRRKGARRAQLEHLADLEKLEREAGGEALEHPAGIRPLLDQPEALEAVEELADAGGRDAELPRQLEFVDGGAGARVVPQHPFHEPLLDLRGHRHGFRLRKPLGSLLGRHERRADAPLPRHDPAFAPASTGPCAPSCG